MTRVKDSSETNTLDQGLDNTEMDLVVNNGTSLGVVYRVNAFVISIVLIAIFVLDLATVTGIVKEESVIGLSIWHEPTHSADDVFPGRNHDWVSLIISQQNHVLSLVAIALYQESRNIVYVVDTSPQLALLVKVVDADEKCLATTGTFGVLESIAFGGSVAELLGYRGRRRSWSSVLGVVVKALRERKAVGVEMRRRRVIRGRVSSWSGIVPGVTTVLLLGRRRSRWRAVPITITAASVIPLTWKVGHVVDLICGRWWCWESIDKVKVRKRMQEGAFEIPIARCRNETTMGQPH
jgi:hypothetical protein